MSAYWVAFVRVTNPDQYKLYADRATQVLRNANARALARGGPFHIMEGFEDGYNRFAFAEFSSFDDALATYRSDEYQQAAEFRRNGGGVAEIAIVDGEDGVEAAPGPGPAYYLARAQITNPEQYAKYLTGTADLFAKAPTRALARGSRYEILEGPTHYNRYVVMEFPTLGDATGYYNDPVYQQAAELRRNGGGPAEIVILESG